MKGAGKEREEQGSDEESRMAGGEQNGDGERRRTQFLTDSSRL